MFSALDVGPATPARRRLATNAERQAECLLIIDLVSNDNLRWGGTFFAGYKVRYVFRITGNIQGDATDSVVSFTVDSHPTEFWHPPAGHQGPFVDTWATQSYQVFDTFQQSVRVVTQAKFEVNTQDWPEGSQVAGTADLGNTVVLDQIIVTDEDDNVVSGWTLESDSGTNYLAIDRVFGDRFQATP